MNQPALKQDIVIKDISREPRVHDKNAPRVVTHTVALIPPNYVSTLCNDVEEHLRLQDRVADGICNLCMNLSVKWNSICGWPLTRIM